MAAESPELGREPLNPDGRLPRRVSPRPWVTSDRTVAARRAWPAMARARGAAACLFVAGGGPKRATMLRSLWMHRAKVPDRTNTADNLCEEGLAAVVCYNHLLQCRQTQHTPHKNTHTPPSAGVATRCACPGRARSNATHSSESRERDSSRALRLFLVAWAAPHGSAKLVS